MVSNLGTLHLLSTSLRCGRCLTPPEVKCELGRVRRSIRHIGAPCSARHSHGVTGALLPGLYLAFGFACRFCGSNSGCQTQQLVWRFAAKRDSDDDELNINPPTRAGIPAFLAWFNYARQSDYARIFVCGCFFKYVFAVFFRASARKKKNLCFFCVFWGVFLFFFDFFLCFSRVARKNFWVYFSHYAKQSREFPLCRPHRARLASAHQHQNPKENRPAIREPQVEGICGVMRHSAAVGFCGGFGGGSGGGGEGLRRDWVVLWGVGRCGRRGPRGQESLDALSGRRHEGATSLGLSGRAAVALALLWGGA